MKKLTLVALMMIHIAYAQTFVAKSMAGEDQTATLQNALKNPDAKTILVTTNTRIDGTLDIPAGKTVKVEPGCQLTGSGVINGGNFDADYQVQIFDTSLTVNPKSVNQYFSVKWFGAKGNNTDDYAAIQKAINTCIRNNIRTLYFPAGVYRISRPLILRGSTPDEGRNNTRGFCTLELLGESSFWDSNTGSEIHPTFDDAFAIGIQDGKGCKVRKLKLVGLFQPPTTGDPKKFYSLSFDQFTDGRCRDSRNSPYAGIVIDPFTNQPGDRLPPDGGYPSLRPFYGRAPRLSSQSGSTGTELEELSISGFVVGICSSPNGLTRNAEITLINKVQFSNCKLCISGGQDQEKENAISNIYCWGGTHTVFGTDLYGGPRMSGNWSIDHVNIAGEVVRFIYNDQHGYFPTYISHVFAESLGTFGVFNSELASEVSDCIFDFAYPDVAGAQVLLVSNGSNVLFRSCNFRYYGQSTPLRMQASCVFDHCYFSGPVTR